MSSKASRPLRYQRIGNSYEHTNLILLLPGREKKDQLRRFQNKLEMLDQPRHTKPILQASILFPLEAHSKTYYFIFDGLPTPFLTPSQPSSLIFFPVV